jgi:hypothetical protein
MHKLFHLLLLVYKSRQDNNDPQFQRIILEPDPTKKGIQDIVVYSQ